MALTPEELARKKRIEQLKQQAKEKIDTGSVVGSKVKPKTTTQTVSPVTPAFIDPELEAKKALDAQRSAAIAAGELVSLTPEQTENKRRVDEALRLSKESTRLEEEEFKSETSALQRKLVAAEAELKKKEAREIEEARRQEGVVTMGTVEGREGITTSAAPQVREEAVGRIQSDLQSFQANIASQRAGIADLEGELQRAIQSKDIKKQQEVLNELNLRDANILKEQAALDKLQKQSSVQAFSILNSLPSETLAAMGDAGIAALFESQGATIDPIVAKGISAGVKEIIEDKALDDEERALRINSLKADVQRKATSDAAKLISQAREIDAAVQEGTITAKAASALKQKLGLEKELKVETSLEKAQRLKIEAQTAEITEQTTPTSSARTINISDTTTGEPLPLNSLGDSSKVRRTDRHNNPIANKAYDITIQRLKDAGLVEGVDFNVGETTEGIDSDGVATIVYTSPEAGTLGSIQTLKAGEIGSWYANPKYGGAGKIQAKLSELSGKTVTSLNAQEEFNKLSTADQTEVVKEIYAHEGGTQLFKPVALGLTPAQKLQSAAVIVDKFGQKALKNETLMGAAEDLLKQGNTVDDIQDMIRMSNLSEATSGDWLDALEDTKIRLSASKGRDFEETIDRKLQSGDLEGAQTSLKTAIKAGSSVDERKALNGKERTVEFVNEIGEDLKVLEDQGIDTNIFEGTTEEVAEKLGTIKDPEMARIANKIQLAIQAYRKALSGAAFSVPESKEYQAIFPSLSNTSALNSAKIKGLNEAMSGDVDFFYESIIGEKVYNNLIKNPLQTGS